MNKNQHLLLTVNRLPGHHGVFKRRLLDACRDEADLAAALPDYLNRLSPRTRRRPINLNRLRAAADAEIRRLQRAGISCTVLGDPDYPENLGHIPDPPFILYRRGCLPIRHLSPVAIVGTRRPTDAGRREAYRLALEFALSGYPVVSGLAFGIDRSAHEGALAGGGATWAVLAGGLDSPSPRAHRFLARRILDNGGSLLGEIPPGVFPAKYAFPRRNRILSGLARGCIVVQAPRKSGALITADFALDQNRDLFISAAGLEGPFAAGTGSLEAQGAPVARGAADVLAEWGRFTDIRSVRNLHAPCGGEDLAHMLKNELDGRLHHHGGGWFEHRIS